MFKQGRFHRLLFVVLMVAVPVAAFSAEGTVIKKRRARADKTAVVAKDTPKEGLVPPGDKMGRARQLLTEMQAEIEDYGYKGLFLSPETKPAAGLVAFPADKFNAQVDEIAKIAKECRKQMVERQVAARAHYQKISAPQMAAFTACDEGMDEAAELIGQLRNTANLTFGPDPAKDARYYLSLSRAERTLAKILALTEVCQHNMERAEMLCKQFESAPAAKKAESKVVY